MKNRPPNAFVRSLGKVDKLQQQKRNNTCRNTSQNFTFKDLDGNEIPYF